jgi:hypothetical protein
LSRPIIPHRRGPLTQKVVECRAAVERDGAQVACGQKRALPVEATGKIRCDRCGAIVKVAR